MIRNRRQGTHKICKCEQSGKGPYKRSAAEVQKKALTQRKIAHCCRAAVVHGKKKDWLLLCIHHLVVDGVSWRILLENIMNSYRKEKAKEEIHLPARNDIIPGIPPPPQKCPFRRIGILLERNSLEDLS